MGRAQGETYNTTPGHLMRTTKDTQGAYTVTGHTRAGELVQYTVTKNGHGWTAELVYGKGQVFNALYDTKAQAVDAIKNQG
jgi:hypothetical protein